MAGTVTGCTGNTSEHGLTIKDGRLKITIPADRSDCFTLSQGGLTGPISAVVRWRDTAGSATAIVPTHLLLNGQVTSLNSKDQFTFALPPRSDTVSESGSFGAGTVTTGTGIGYHTVETVTQIVAACNSPGGLASVKIVVRTLPRHCASLPVFFCINE